MSMSLFPASATILTGGCFCSAIRYTITIPEAAARPAVPHALPTPIPPLHRVTSNVSTAANAPTGTTHSLTADFLASTSSNTTAEAENSSTQQSIPRTNLPNLQPAAIPNSLPTTYPILELDHCTSCRRACGSIVQCWLVIPLSWVSFRLLRRSQDAAVSLELSPENPKSNPSTTATTDADFSTDPGLEEAELVAQDVLLPSQNLRQQTYLGHYTGNNTSHRPFCARCGTPFGFYWFDATSPAVPRGEDDNSETEVDVFDIAAGTLDTDCLSLLGGKDDSLIDTEPNIWTGTLSGSMTATGTRTDNAGQQGEAAGGSNAAIGMGMGIGIGIQRHSHWDSGVGWIKHGMYRGWERVRHPGGLPVAVADEDRELLGR